MCPADSAKNTIEFKNYYCIEPTIKFTNSDTNYLINKTKEKGKRVKEFFEYSSVTAIGVGFTLPCVRVTSNE